MSTLDELLTTDEVAELLNIPRSTVSDYARRGVLPSVKLGDTDGSCAQMSTMRSNGCAAAAPRGSRVPRRARDDVGSPARPDSTTRSPAPVGSHRNEVIVVGVDRLIASVAGRRDGCVDHGQAVLSVELAAIEDGRIYGA